MITNMTSLALALTVACAPLAAQAGETVTYVIDGESFEGYRAESDGDSKGLVLIIHDWDGLTEYEMKRADMLAALGYDAFALDLYGKGNRPTGTKDKQAKTKKLYDNRARMRKLIRGGLEKAREDGDQQAVVMGYCFGGAAVLELARSGEADNVVGYATFHGALATPKGQSYASDTPPILVMHGGADTSITMADVAALSAELESAKVPYEIEIYSGAPHAFTNFAGDRYQKRADDLSWRAFHEFLAANLAN